jgi:hypothetical protein
VNLGVVEVVDDMLIYTARGSFFGTVEIDYSITDGNGGFDTATVTLEIESGLFEGPTIETPTDVVVNADALYTRVDVGIASAVDSLGRPVPVSLIDGNLLFAPGNHIIYWQATDEVGNLSIAQQRVVVKPLVSLSKSRIVPEGSEQVLRVVLNGESPTYPVNVDVAVSGTADTSDHNATLTKVTINNGTEVLVPFSVIADDIAEGDETLVFTLAENVNRGSNFESVYTIKENNIAPTVSISSQQNNVSRAVMFKGSEEAVFVAQAYDQNIGDVVTLRWQLGDLVEASRTEDSISIDISELAIGLHQISVTATDNGNPALSVNQQLFFEVVDEAPLLSSLIDSDGDLIPDSEEGLSDSDGDGVPDYLDAIAECNVMPINAEQQESFLSEGEPGICIRKGETSTLDTTGGLALTLDSNQPIEKILPADTEAMFIGGLFDYIATGLPTVGQAYHIVFPQQAPIPSDATYRKYGNGVWSEFVVDEGNQVYSTAGEPGYCPPPRSDLWTEGLTEGHWCVQLKVTDGGSNDMDGEANGTVVDPGGVAVLITPNNLPNASNDTVELPWNTVINVPVLANDVDSDGDILTVTSATASLGSVLIETDGSLTFTPAVNQVGSVTISYGISDGNGGSDFAEVTVSVIGNSAAITAIDNSDILQGDMVTLDLTLNDVDPDGDVLTVINVDHPSAVINADGTVTFAPLSVFSGSDVVNYTVTDEFGNTAEGLWNINVTRVYQIKGNVKSVNSGGSFYWLLLLLAFISFVRHLKLRTQHG